MHRAALITVAMVAAPWCSAVLAGSPWETANLMVLRDWDGSPGGYAIALLPNPGTMTIIGAADMNGGGTADIVLQQGDGTVRVWLTEAGETEWDRTIGSGVGSAWHIAGLGDIDGNGQDDIIWLNEGTGKVTTWMNWNGTTGGFISGWIGDFAQPEEVLQVIVGDLNNDGRDDIISTSNSVGPQFTVWVMDGLDHQTVTFGGIGGDIVGLTRVDGGGAVNDIVMWNTSTGSVSAVMIVVDWDGLPDIHSVVNLYPGTPPGWSLVKTGRFDVNIFGGLVWQSDSVGLWIDIVEHPDLNGGWMHQGNVTGWTVADVADIDGDGLADILMHYPPPGCPDFNDDGIVGVDDLLAIIDAWGTFDRDLDTNADGTIDVSDLLDVIDQWGDCG